MLAIKIVGDWLKAVVTKSLVSESSHTQTLSCSQLLHYQTTYIHWPYLEPAFIKSQPNSLKQSKIKICQYKPSSITRATLKISFENFHLLLISKLKAFRNYFLREYNESIDIMSKKWADLVLARWNRKLVPTIRAGSDLDLNQHTLAVSLGSTLM